MDRDDRFRKITITPEFARNTPRGPNRPLSKARWQKYARAMERGEWDGDADDLYKFNAEGELVEGQHRFEAVISSGITIQGLAIFGVDQRSVEHMGQGAARTLGEVLAMRGEVQYNVLAASINVAYRWYTHGVEGIQRWSGSYGPSREQALQFLDEHPNLREAVKNTRGRYTEFFKGVVRPGLAAGLWYILNDIDSDNCIDFFEKLVSGVNLDESNPIYLLRERLLALKSEGMGLRGLPEYNLMAYFFKTWLAYVDGRSMGQLKFMSGGANPEKFPLPRAGIS